MGWWEEKILEIQEKFTPHDLVLGKTTTGQEGSPSGRNVGPTRPSNPAESGIHLTSCKLLEMKNLH